MTRRRMISLDSGLSSLQIGKERHQHGLVTEEISGLITVYRDGHVERSQIVPCVTSKLPPELGVSSTDIIIDKFTNIWVRFYVPTCNRNPNQKLPVMVYFHGGGFCVGSAAWICYHDFLARLAAETGCLIMSVNYRLAPENPLPAAYKDGITALMWLKKQGLLQAAGCDQQWWFKQCNFSDIFLAGDSAGANIAYNIIRILGSGNFDASAVNPVNLKGIILIQPFFGGEERTSSEENLTQSSRSVLSLASSDTYWRLALPSGTNRDHPWCNPLAKQESLEKSMEVLSKTMMTTTTRTIQSPTMVCISELDILKDRNLEFVAALSDSKGDKRVELVVHEGVGHGFQVLSNSQLSQTRTIQMMSQIKGFITRSSELTYIYHARL